MTVWEYDTKFRSTPHTQAVTCRNPGNCYNQRQFRSTPHTQAVTAKLNKFALLQDHNNIHLPQNQLVHLIKFVFFPSVSPSAPYF